MQHTITNLRVRAYSPRRAAAGPAWRRRAPAAGHGSVSPTHNDLLLLESKLLAQGAPRPSRTRSGTRHPPPNRPQLESGSLPSNFRVVTPPMRPSSPVRRAFCRSRLVDTSYSEARSEALGARTPWPAHLSFHRRTDCRRSVLSAGTDRASHRRRRGTTVARRHGATRVCRGYVAESMPSLARGVAARPALYSS